MDDWLVLTASLPAAPSRLRVRIWRALKATGCATLRDGVYIVPAAATTAANDLRSIAAAIADAGADAHLLEIRARDAAQEKTFRSLFDRSGQYAEFAKRSRTRANRCSRRRASPSCAGRCARSISNSPRFAPPTTFRARPASALPPDSRSCAPRSSNDSLRASRHRARARPSACRGAASRAGPGRRASAPGSIALRPPG